MKLGKLLAAGKSIMNGRTEVSYRSSKQIYLPKFGSAKNPFKPESAEQPVETAPPSAAAAEPRASGSDAGIVARLAAGATEAFRPLKRDMRDAVNLDANGCNAPAVRRLSSSTPLPANPQPAATVVQTARIPQFSKFNPLSILRGALPGGRAKDSAKTVKGQKGTPTQTELSLDTVRVVHNDLSDVDVEVVPIKSRSAAPELPAPRKSWEFVGERLFGVEAT